MKEKRAQPDENVDLPAKKKAKTEEPSSCQQQNNNGRANRVDRDDKVGQVEQAGQTGQRGTNPDREVQKRKRVRVKTLRQDICKQLEFYFCDANLRKDRYMKELVAGGHDGWVNVEEFLKFNKIKTLLEKKGIDAIEVAKAAKESELIEVSNDLSKVRRNLEKFPIKEKNQEEVDDCTIYIQGLPPTANIDSIRGLFSDFGLIEYVSLPRKASGEHKGFAFVEFAEKAGAENSCKFHNLRTGGTGFNTAAEQDRVTSSARADSAPLNNIQVISKKEWTEYKQQYLKLRKENAKMTKKFLSTFASSAGPDVNIARNEHQKNARQPKGYLDETTNREDRPEAKGVPDAEQVEGGEVEVQDRPQYVEGCIVKLEATEPLSKTAKTTLREIPGVAYVDLMENDPIVFLRFPSSEESRTFVESNSELSTIAVKTKVILEGQEEELYWQRVESMRVKKRKREREKQRGREKLQGRYDKHVATQEKHVFNKRIVFAD